ncbi:hypothetical protein EX30DRAFT_270285 [Ascodesmis nigricans]|uniref:Uncharacterized protein n=1 Tax=Ascodesmis nigricans TaxID=341454 RepID=A0A4S2MXB4_9PEZI|nr:hypothetical protein EX30DRAFT_270285 [Ascodesmis nigricans]
MATKFLPVSYVLSVCLVRKLALPRIPDKPILQASQLRVTLELSPLRRIRRLICTENYVSSRSKPGRNSEALALILAPGVGNFISYTIS